MNRYLRQMAERAMILLAAIPLVETVRGADEPSKSGESPAIKRADSTITFRDDSWFRQRYYRTNRYDVWQFYGVARNGHFRPRVIYFPEESYYLYNGETYPWFPTHQRDIMPYVSDVP